MCANMFAIPDLSQLAGLKDEKPLLIIEKDEKPLLILEVDLNLYPFHPQ